MAEPHFEGHEGRECGEHRTVGYRAWCFDCSEWCYPKIPCKGCELPGMRAAIERVRAVHVISDMGECTDCCASWPCPTVRALDAPEIPAPAPTAVSAVTEAHGGAGEAQEG